MLNPANNKRFLLPLILFIVFTLHFNTVQCKTRSIDSLSVIISTNHKSDTGKVNQLIQLSKFYSNENSLDSSLYFSEEALKLAQQLSYKKGLINIFMLSGYVYYRKENYERANYYDSMAIKLCDEIDKTYELMRAHVQMGFLQAEYNNWGSALSHNNAALKIAQQLNDKKSKAAIYNNLADIYQSCDNYPKALEYMLLSLKEKERTSTKQDIARAHNNIGSVYFTLGMNNEAIDSYNKSIALRKTINDEKGLSFCYNNIGIIYQHQNKLTEALNNYYMALEIAKNPATINKPLIAEASINIAGIYKEQKKYSDAINFLTLAIQTNESIGNRSGKANAIIALSEIYIELNDLKTAKTYLLQGLDFAKETDSKLLLQVGYENLTRLDSIQNDWQAAYKHHRLAVLYRDSISNEDIKNKITEITLTSKFETETEKLKAENEKQQLIAEAENRRQKIISWSVGIGLLLVLISTAFIFRSLRITTKQKNLINEQKQIVEEKQQEIVASINYAKRIQTALLTNSEYINNNFEAGHFILFKPKDIVSGDFYWAQSVILPDNTKLFYLITADCTGHGVPGAFMSMLNISFLTENILERKILMPHDILNTQRQEIIKALNQQGNTEESKDGMDCILCAYDFKNMLLHYAAANNPLWLIRNNELKEYKADKMPVGKYHDKVGSFTLQTIELQKGDVIYTSTDGFPDQFGSQGKKLTKKKLKEELLKIHTLPIAEQKEYLNHFFENWKGDAEQIDDVCLIGVKI